MISFSKWWWLLIFAVVAAIVAISTLAATGKIKFQSEQSDSSEYLALEDKRLFGRVRIFNGAPSSRILAVRGDLVSLCLTTNVDDLYNPNGLVVIGEYLPRQERNKFTFVHKLDTAKRGRIPTRFDHFPRSAIHSVSPTGVLLLMSHIDFDLTVGGSLFTVRIMLSDSHVFKMGDLLVRKQESWHWYDEKSGSLTGQRSPSVRQLRNISVISGRIGQFPQMYYCPILVKIRNPRPIPKMSPSEALHVDIDWNFDSIITSEVSAVSPTHEAVARTVTFGGLALRSPSEADVSYL